MRAIIVPTDFSVPSVNAARYAVRLAGHMAARVKLCHAVKVADEAIMAAQVVWPLEDYTTIKTETTVQLKLLAESLEAETAASGSSQLPAGISFCSETGNVTDVVRNIAVQHKQVLVIMGLSGAGMLSRLFLGSNSHDMIDKACFPLLLVPAAAGFKQIRKIALATDLQPGDIDVIHSVAGLARYFDAEVLLFHVTEKDAGNMQQKKVDDFLSRVTCTVNYDKIYYRALNNISVNNGLEWLMVHGNVDLLAMVHRSHSLPDSLFSGSYTQKAARHTVLPLLVLRDGCKVVF